MSNEFFDEIRAYLIPPLNVCEATSFFQIYQICSYFLLYLIGTLTFSIELAKPYVA